jgi:hypothetical protein
MPEFSSFWQWIGWLAIFSLVCGSIVAAVERRRSNGG